MSFNFKKNITVGVSVDPERGLEVAQIDFDLKKVLKYGVKALDYDIVRREVADLDLFKDALEELFIDLEIPKGADITLSLPAASFKVNDYPAALDTLQINNAIEEELAENTLFEQDDPAIAAVKLPNSSIQFNKISYAALKKSMLIEIVMQIQELGYNVVNIDSSVNAILNALIYNKQVNVDPTKNWVLLIVDSYSCKLIPMQGNSYVDYFEERIAIGEVLGDDENYSTVIETVSPLLKNIPSEYLYVVSKTDVISAEILSSKLQYNSQIVHFDANSFAKEALISIDESLKISGVISLDIIGAAINSYFEPYSAARFNFFNSDLGDVYILTQPPVFRFGSIEFVMSVNNMLVVSAIFLAGAVAIIIAMLLFLQQEIKTQEETNTQIKQQIEAEKAFQEKNKDISTEVFNEGDEINIGTTKNKNVYSYYTIVGTEIPQKLWLTRLVFGEHIVIEGQADNLESVYGFYRNIKDYDTNSNIKLQKLGLASNSKNLSVNADEKFDTGSILSSLNADYYQFRISDTASDVVPNAENSAVDENAKVNNNNSKSKTNTNSGLPANLEPIE